MKRILSFLTIMALLLSCTALAESDGETMTVVNCEEWVSLRAKPSTSSARLAKVPLGETVTNCRAYSDRFTSCEYQGQSGYILTEYLALAEDDGDTAGEDDDHEIALDQEVVGVHILAERSYGNDEETMSLTCTDVQSGETLWTRTVSGIATELTCTAAFIGGTAEAPTLIVGVADVGVTGCDPRTGETLWTVTREESGLSAGLCYALAADGTLYVGGFYGPDPVAIDAGGSVLWRADAQDDDTYWLYELVIQEDVLAAHYDHLIEEDAGWVYYDLKTGEKLGIERE